MTEINSLGLYLINYTNKKNYLGNIKSFGIKDEFIKEGKKEELLKLLELDEKGIVEKIKLDLKNKI